MYSGMSFRPDGYDFDWDNEKHKDINFYRPDGDMEGKSIHWCEIHGFYQVEAGTWSGDWYYQHFPDKIPGKEERHKKFRDRRLQLKTIERQHRKLKECLDYLQPDPTFDCFTDWEKSFKLSKKMQKLSQKMQRLMERKKELEYENNSDALMDTMMIHPDDLERNFERLVLKELDEIEERLSETDLKPRSQPKPKPTPKPAQYFLVPSQVVRKKK